jgi:predicted nucleic acid-binding Zn ribbon protein
MTRNFISNRLSRRAAERKPAARVTTNAGKGNLHMSGLIVVRDDDNCSDRAPARTRNITCAVCGRAIVHTSGRRPQVCSTRCRNRKNGRGRVRKAFLIGDTGGAAKRRKNNNDSNALQRAKTLSSRGIFGPVHVLAVEVFDRTWKPTISSSGVPVEVGRLRARALVAS